MIHLDFNDDKIYQLEQLHYRAVKSYVSQTMKLEERNTFRQCVTELPGLKPFAGGDSDNYAWLEAFILASPMTLKEWADQHQKLLSFNHMKMLYLNRFSNGANCFVDKEGTYNAYTLYNAMGWRVCPYCEDEYIMTLIIHGQRARTLEFDHFFSKGTNEYPGLAMCFYNLIPSCKDCNQLKKTHRVEANPYDAAIELQSYFTTTIPVGTNMHSIGTDDFYIKLNPTGGMIVNDKSFGLEQRYQNHKDKVYGWLSAKQDYPDEKLEEMQRLGIPNIQDLKKHIFGDPLQVVKGKVLHTKLRRDLISE